MTDCSFFCFISVERIRGVPSVGTRPWSWRNVSFHCRCFSSDVRAVSTKENDERRGEVAVIKANEGGNDRGGWARNSHCCCGSGGRLQSSCSGKTSHGMQYKEMGLEDVLEKLRSLVSFPLAMLAPCKRKSALEFNVGIKRFMPYYVRKRISSQT